MPASPPPRLRLVPPELYTDLSTGQPGRRLPKPRPHPIPLPPEFALTLQIRDWAEEHGIERLKDRFEHFIDVALAKGYEYADWPAAFRNACRQDWARLGPPRQLTYCATCGMAIQGGWIQRGHGRVHAPGCDT